MGIDYIFVWYQQKIGAYDKQKWETKIEQREQRIYGLNHIQTRSTKPNTELIDLDLVRGSSFTKAKPKHGFLKVFKLATLRYLFFPLYGKWWMEQTSKYVFALCLFLYASQIVSVFAYFHHSTALSCMEIIIPSIMMWALSLVHSQIIATSPSTDIKKPRMKQRHVRRRRSCIKKKRKSDEQDEQTSKGDNMSNKTENQSDNSLVNRIDPSDPDFKRKRLFFCENDPSEKVSDLAVIEKETDQNISIEDIGHEGNNSIEDSAGSDSDTEEKFPLKQKKKVSIIQRNKVQVPQINVTSQDSNCDTEDEAPSSPEMRQTGPLNSPLSGDLTSSATDWIGVTTNSEDCSYSSDMDNISDSQVEKDKDFTMYDNDLAPTAILNRPSVRVSCIVWERNEIKKADLSMLDISSAIIGKVELMPESMDYFYIGIFFSTIIASLPIICKILNLSTDLNFLEAQIFLEEMYTNVTATYNTSYDLKIHSTLGYYRYVLSQIYTNFKSHLFQLLSSNSWEFTILTITFIQRWILALMIFFLLAVAERTFKQRLLYAKLFSHLTSSRRARKSDLPHFRLNKVINIKTWLSVRSYLKKRGPQRSVDIIVSTAFVANLLLLTFLCVEVLKDTVLFSQYYLEALIWCLGLGIMLLRFMTLGTKINRKYRNLSVLITEQINLHLQIEQKPHKKEEFNVANNVLKLAIDLLKELENPFKISGISANPILYNVTKLVILSALSGVLSEMLGFKLKLHKIKLK